MLETLQQHVSHLEYHLLVDGIFTLAFLWMWQRKRYYKKKYEELNDVVGNEKQEKK